MSQIKINPGRTLKEFVAFYGLQAKVGYRYSLNQEIYPLIRMQLIQIIHQIKSVKI